MKNRYPLILGLLVVSFSQQTHAADGTWNVDANGTWSTSGNWVSDIANGSGSTAYFANNITADRTVSLDGDRTLTNLVFGDSDTETAGSWILNNNGTSTNNLILAGTTPTITVNALGTAKTATISAIIEGSSGLVKAGAGRLDLSGANTFTGGVTIKEGRLSVSGSLSSSTSANPIGTSAGTILLGDTTGSADAQVFGASSSGTYTIANALTVQSGSDGTKEFGAYSSSVTYSGAITLNDSASFRHLGGTGTLTSNGGITVASGKTLTLNPNAGTTITISGAGGGILGDGSVTTVGSSTGTLSLTGNSTFSGGFTLGGSALVVPGSSSAGPTGSPTASAFGTGIATLSGGNLRSTTGSDTTVSNTLRLSGNITFPSANGEKNLTLSGPVTIKDSSRTLTVNIGSGSLNSNGTGGASGKSLVISGAVDDEGNGYGITKSGTGEIILSGANTFSGATTVSDGRLTLSNSLALQNSAFNTTDSVAGSATAGLKTTVTTLTFGGLTGSNALAGRFLTFGGYSGVTALTLNPQSGSVSYSGAIAEGATGMTLTKKGAGTQVLSGANTYTGGTIIEAGVLSVNDSSALGSSSSSITLNGGTLTVTNATTSFSARTSLVVGTNGGTFNKAGNGQSQLPNISGSGNTLTVSGANGNSGLIIFKQTGTNTLGTLNLSANNTSVDFGTNTSIGTVNLSSATHIANLNSGASATEGTYDNVSFTLSNGGMIRNRFGQNTLSTAITLTGDGVIANRATTEAFTFSGTVSSSATSGTQTLGILTDSFNGHQGTVTQSSGSVISDGDSGGKVALTVGANSTSGTVTLNGTNTYTGATTINGGTLVINGNQSAATGDVTVNNAGTRLQGAGTIGGDTTINAGAIHSVGNSVGKQTFHDGTSTSLTYAEGSIFEWELGATLKDSDTVGATRGTDWDAVNVSGTLGTTGDGAIFRVVLNGSTDFDDAFWLQDREWKDIFKTSDAGSLVDFEAVFSGFQQYNYSGVDGALANLGDVSSYGSFAISGSSLTWTAVPEPTSALAGLLVAAGLLRRRRQN